MNRVTDRMNNKIFLMIIDVVFHFGICNKRKREPVIQSQASPSFGTKYSQNFSINNLDFESNLDLPKYHQQE